MFSSRYFHLFVTSIFLIAAFGLCGRSISAQDPPPESAPSATEPGNQAAQDSTPKDATTPATTDPAVPATGDSQPASTETLEALLADWKVLEQQLADKEAAYKVSTADSEKETLRNDYFEMLNRAYDLIDRIRETGLTNLTANPTDQTLQKTVIGVMMNDAQSNRDDLAFRAGDGLISAQADIKLLETAAAADRLSISAKEIIDEVITRYRESQTNLPRAKITTSKGEIVVELFENEAPNTVANFIELAEKKFYDGLKFHRVLDGFMAQTGDPNGDGTGGPGYTIACECYTPEARRHFTGSLSMAKKQPRDTGGSQFFLVFERSEGVQRLDGQHTVFGRIISGSEVLGVLTRTHESLGAEETPIAGAVPDTIVSVEILRKRDHEYVAKKIGEESSDAPTPPPQQPDNKSFDKGGEAGADKSGAEKPEADKSGG